MAFDITHHEYDGPERRRHRVLITRNSEYHCRDGVCVAVRDRNTNEFVTSHPALGTRLSGGVHIDSDGGVASSSSPTEPRIGHKIWFSSGDHDHPESVLTTKLRAIERPPKEIVSRYPH
jgi:hypothetical protein